MHMKNYNRLPSIEELRNHSRLYRFCGANASLIILFLCIILLIQLFLKLGPLLCSTVLVILELSLQLGVFNFVQLLVTQTPTDRELNVAIEGLKAWIENEQKSTENNFSDFS